MISLQLMFVLGIVALAAAQLALDVRSQWRSAMAKRKSSCGGCAACPVSAKGQTR